MEFPKVNFRSEKACFEALLKLVHPAGFGCPRCQASGGMQIHENHRQPWHIRYRCSLCNKEFNVWTGIRLHGTHRPPSEILRIMQGIVKGKSNSQMARELKRNRGKLAQFRRNIQQWVVSMFGPPPPEKSAVPARPKLTPQGRLISAIRRPTSFPRNGYNFAKSHPRGLTSTNAGRQYA